MRKPTIGLSLEGLPSIGLSAFVTLVFAAMGWWLFALILEYAEGQGHEHGGGGEGRDPHAQEGSRGEKTEDYRPGRIAGERKD